jgi:hypothetical protein
MSEALNLLLVGGQRRLYYECAAMPPGAGSAEAARLLAYVEDHGRPTCDCCNSCLNESVCRSAEYALARSPNLTKSQVSLCVAVSADGLAWTKPALNLSTFNGSKANNILWPRDDSAGAASQASAGVVWEDTHPGTPAAQRYKSLGTTPDGVNVLLVSPDGLDFSYATLPGSRKPRHVKGTHGKYSDCHGPEHYDEVERVWVSYCQAPCYNASIPGKYVCSNPASLYHGERPPGRRCLGSFPGAEGKAADRWLAPSNRRIGRCVSGALFEWDCHDRTTSLVMSFDEADPPCLDLYTQKTMALSGNDRLFFPSAYAHVVFAQPRCNDGLRSHGQYCHLDAPYPISLVTIDYSYKM